jgi:lysophospholipase L1-like esterase
MKDTKKTNRPWKRFILSVILAILVIVGVVIFSIWCLFEYEVRTYSKYWQDRIKQPGEIVYVALGDSTAQGIGATKPENGYVNLVASKLAEATGRTVRVVNLSESGAEIPDVLSRQIPKITLYNPDFITISIGGNDINRGVSKQEYINRISALVKELPEDTLINDSPYFERGKKEEIAQLSVQLIEQYAQTRNLLHVRLHDATKVHFEDWDQYSYDLFHPSDKAYKVWADTYWQAAQPAVMRLIRMKNTAFSGELTDSM